jgi:hypothetical protein
MFLIEIVNPTVQLASDNTVTDHRDHRRVECAAAVLRELGAEHAVERGAQRDLPSAERSSGRVDHREGRR